MNPYTPLEILCQDTYQTDASAALKLIFKRIGKEFLIGGRCLCIKWSLRNDPIFTPYSYAKASPAAWEMDNIEFERVLTELQPGDRSIVEKMIELSRMITRGHLSVQR